MAVACAVYRQREAERGVLHAVVRTHLETSLREATHWADGAGLPQFVEQEFREFLTCGILAHGFARLRCDTCAEETAASDSRSRPPGPNGTSHLLFEPLEFLEKLAALIPRSRVNLVLLPRGACASCALALPDRGPCGLRQRRARRAQAFGHLEL